MASESPKEISKSSSRIYRFGPFSLNPSERLLFQDDDTPIALTPKAFDLLVLLVENSNRLLEKEALMRQLWSDTFVEEANLSNNISLLRKALGESETGAKYIETVPKRGYRFVASVTDGEERNSAPAGFPVQTFSRQGIGLVAAVMLVGIAVAVAIALWVSTSRARSAAPVRFVVAPPTGTELPRLAQPIGPSISPDGTRLAFHVIRGGEQLLAVRALDALQAQLLPGTEGGRFPFWSPDSREIAFFAGGKLKRLALAGGPVQTICDAGVGFGGSWNRDGLIIFASGPLDRLLQVPAKGGRPTALTSLQQGEQFHHFPFFLPDGRRFLYFASPDAVLLQSLDGGAPLRVLTSDRMALLSASGYLVFGRGRTLMAQRFVDDRAEVAGDPIVLGEDLGAGTPGILGFSISETAVAYAVRSPAAFSLRWVDRSGRRLGTLGPFHFGAYGDVELSPDGKHIAIVSAGDRSRNADIWLFDSSGRQPSQLTFGPPSRFPVWSFDSRALLFTSARPGAPGIYQKAVGGGTAEEMILPSDSRGPTPLLRPADWSRRGIVYEVGDPETRTISLWMMPSTGNREPYRLVSGGGSQRDGRVSPDGKWLAYTTDQSGRAEVFVQSVATPDLKSNISTTGGSQPRWRRDGKELFFVSTDGTLMAVPIIADAATLRKGPVQPLFHTGLNMLSDLLRSFAVSPDGQQFLISDSDNPEPVSSIVVISNWQAELKR